ncbi:MAG: YfcE family phosphodiesterase [Pseudomonadales bacterium]|nr:YfcE family phosphodiesterase [Pseudomonadales bacterium]
MRIGIVSDTHNNLRNVARIVELFNGARVDRIIHTGDITQAKTLEVFRHLDAPMYGVFGNNDQERDTLIPAIARNGFVFQEPPFELVWHERRIIVVHDPLEFEGHLNPDHHVALHGHTHLYRHELRHGSLIFNPGECAGHMPGYNAIGVLDLEDLSTEILRF